MSMYSPRSTIQPSPLRDEFATHPNGPPHHDPAQRRPSPDKIVESSPSSPSLSFTEDTDEAIISTSVPISRVAQSVAEKARERRLRADPMANVLGPLHVDCKICGTRIKLSSKSLYDTCHWDTHRTRCLKRNKAKKFPLLKRSIKTNPSHFNRAFARSDFHSSNYATVHRAETEPRRSIPTHENTTHTPPLAIDFTAQAIFEEYLLRFHGKKYKPSSVSTDWRDWSWSQLLYPRITTVLEPESSGFQDDELLGDPVSTAVF